MLAIAAFLAAGSAHGQKTNTRVRVIRPIKKDVSPPFRDMAAAAATGGAPIAGVPDANAGLGGTSNITVLLNFAGMPSGGAYLDADPNGAVGITQYVQWTNARYAVYNKSTGATVVPPTAAKSLWSGFGGSCEATNSGDGVVQFDKAAQRWVISHHSGGSGPFLQCFAVSMTSDASGQYYRYAFQLTNQFPDWPKIGVWPDAYYITMNLQDPTTYASLGAEVCALDRASMIAGSAAATAQCFTTGSASTDYVLEPADLDGLTPPPAGAPNYLLSLNVNSLDFYTFHVDWLMPSNSVLTGPTNIAVAPYTNGCRGGFCVPQLGTTNRLDAVGERLMYRLAYRNFGDHESLLVNHAINNQTGSSVGVRWYEIRSPGTTPIIYQYGTIQPDSTFRTMASMAMDKMGNMAIAYSKSSSSMYPAIAFSGRFATDPLGTLQPESTIFAGTGSQTGTNNFHWGDYTSMTVDPLDDCTLWYTNEYYKTSGTLWVTRIASLKFAGCQ